MCNMQGQSDKLSTDHMRETERCVYNTPLEVMKTGNFD